MDGPGADQRLIGHRHQRLPGRAIHAGTWPLAGSRSRWPAAMTADIPRRVAEPEHNNAGCLPGPPAHWALPA